MLLFLRVPRRLDAITKTGTVSPHSQAEGGHGCICTVKAPFGSSFEIAEVDRDERQSNLLGHCCKFKKKKILVEKKLMKA